MSYLQARIDGGFDEVADLERESDSAHELVPRRRKKTPRDPLDRYYTPEPLVRQLLTWAQIPRSWTVVEPSLGGGVWADLLRQSGHTGRIIGCDIDAGASGARFVDDMRIGDWRDIAPTLTADIVVGNPPFKLASDFIRTGLQVAPWVMFVLRSTFVEWTEERAPLWREHQPAMEWTSGERWRFASPYVPDLGHSDTVCHTCLFWNRAKVTAGWSRDVVSVRRNFGPVHFPPWARCDASRVTVNVCPVCQATIRPRRAGGPRPGEVSTCGRSACRTTLYRRRRREAGATQDLVVDP